MDPRHLEHGHNPREIAKRLKKGPHVSYLRDWVYGGIDGTVTTFAVVAGVVGAELSRERWIETMMTEEHGLPLVSRSPGKAAIMTSLAFILCGSVPLLPFIAGAPASIWTSTTMTGFTFFAIGSLRSHWSPAPWWRAGIETFLIGITAAAIAYLVGVILGGIA
jgi:VIT1/CCC1 family predicted Fe2+/Mn2+ transporter